MDTHYLTYKIFFFISYSLMAAAANSILPSEARNAISRATEGYGSGGCRVERATTNSTECILAMKTPHREAKGYVRMKIQNSASRIEYYLHHLAIRARDQDIPDGMEVSHLCHNRTCFNAEHLLLETAVDNRSRNKCIGWTWINSPCGCEKFNPCQHNPQCILPKPE